MDRRSEQLCVCTKLNQLYCMYVVTEMHPRLPSLHRMSQIKSTQTLTSQHQLIRIYSASDSTSWPPTTHTHRHTQLFTQKSLEAIVRSITHIPSRHQSSHRCIHSRSQEWWKHTLLEESRSCMQCVSTPLPLLTFPSRRNKIEEWGRSITRRSVGSTDTVLFARRLSFIYTLIAII